MVMISKSNTRRMLPVIGLAVFTFGSPSAALAQDVAKGKTVFNQCRACHKVGEKARNSVGPTLNGLFGRKAGQVKGYNYSRANRNSGLTWDEATFRKYIKNPRKIMPGTKMAYGGLRQDKRITDLIAYLKQFDADGKIKK